MGNVLEDTHLAHRSNRRRSAKKAERQKEGKSYLLKW